MQLLAIYQILFKQASFDMALGSLFGIMVISTGLKTRSSSPDLGMVSDECLRPPASQLPRNLHALVHVSARIKTDSNEENSIFFKKKLSLFDYNRKKREHTVKYNTVIILH